MYAATTGYSQYRQQAATTASPAQLVMMLYDGALAEIARAERALSATPVDVEDAHDCLSRAQAIVMELSLTLDHERGGQVAGHLASLYTYCSEQLITANVRKSPAELPSVRDVITGLRDAWETACVQQLAPAVAG
jgi:flagellar secretion chaperone FliS